MPRTTNGCWWDRVVSRYSTGCIFSSWQDNVLPAFCRQLERAHSERETNLGWVSSAGSTLPEHRDEKMRHYATCPFVSAGWRKRLANPWCAAQPFPMSLPNEPVTLSAQQVEELRKKISSMRHDVNNHLSLIVAAAELMKLNPDAIGRMTVTLIAQPPKISEEIGRFSAELEKALGIHRG